MPYKLLPEFVLSKDPLYEEALHPINYSPTVSRSVIQDTLSKYFFYPTAAPAASLFNKLVGLAFSVAVTRDLGTIHMALLVSEKISERNSSEGCKKVLEDETCNLLTKELAEAMSASPIVDLLRIGWSNLPRTSLGRWADIVFRPNWDNQRGVWSYVNGEIKTETLRMRVFIPSSFKASKQIITSRNGTCLGAWMITAQEGMNVLMNGLLRPIKFGMGEEGIFPYLNETKRRSPVDEIYPSRLVEGVVGNSASGHMTNYPKESTFYALIAQSRYFNPANFGMNERGEIIDRAPIQWFGDTANRAGLQELWEFHVSKFSEFFKNKVRREGVREYKPSLNDAATLLAVMESLAPGSSNWAKREQEKETFVKVYMGKVRSVVKTVKTDMTDEEINRRLTNLIPDDSEREFTIMSKNPITLRKFLIANKFFEDPPELKSEKTSNAPKLMEVSKVAPTLHAIHAQEADMVAEARRLKTTKVRDAAGNIHTIQTA